MAPGHYQPGGAQGDGGVPDAGGASDAPDSREDVSEPDAMGDSSVDAPDGSRGDAAHTPDADATDPCTMDRDYDGLRDCRERELGTDPSNSDTDGDGINDGMEHWSRTDPLDPDTDGDGADDGEELAVGLNPLRASTLDDGVLDGERWIVDACDTPQPRSVSAHANAPGGFQIALSPHFTELTQLQLSNLTQAGLAATVFADPRSAVAGFAFSKVLDSPNRRIEEVNADLVQTLAPMGTITQDFYGSNFWGVSHAARSELLVELASPTSLRAFRDAVLFAFAPFSPSDISNPTGQGGPEYSEFRLFFSSVNFYLPDGRRRVVTTAAVAPEVTYSPNGLVRKQLVDATDGTNINLQPFGLQQRCRTQPARDKKEVEFYWMLDYADSMQPLLDELSSLAPLVVSKLEGTSLDFRLGVTSMHRSQSGQLQYPPGWHTDAATFAQQIDSPAFASQTDARWRWPFEGSEVGIEFMRGAFGDTLDADEAVRSRAGVAAILITDGEPSEIDRDNVIGDVRSYLLRNVPYYGLVPGQNPNCLRDRHDFSSYAYAAARSGGALASPCVDDLAEPLARFIENAQGRFSAYRLSQWAIGSTVQVYVDGQWVPRSRTNGYFYSPEHNRIAFSGAYRPMLHTAARQVHSVAVHYESWTGPVAKSE